MKILHICDMAGSGAITSNICTKLGHYSHVIQDDNIDTFKHGTYYGNTTYVSERGLVKEYVERNYKSYDHLVYHDMMSLAEDLDYLHVPSSYMFHGNMLRQNKHLYDKTMELESIDNIFVTTEDMLQYAPEAEMFWRPVDLDLFRPMNLRKRNAYLCLTQERYKHIIRQLARNTDNGIFIMDRVKNIIPYHRMPELLSSYSGYVDYKFQPTHPPTMIHELSQTGLQALACGIPVLGFDGEWRKTLPKAYYDENSAKEFIRVIRE